MIHSTAVIHPKAVIGDGCEIGPYCVIGEHVVLGAGCRLHSHIVIDGHTRLGNGNEIFPFASIGLKTQDLKWKGGITRTEIGDENTIRESVTIHSATGDGEATVIGSHNNILACVHVGHNAILGDHVILSSLAGLAGHVLVEDYAVVGGLVGVHQFCRIGTSSIIGGCSAIRQDVLPFMMVSGNPPEAHGVNKVGLERRGVPEATQSALRSAHRILFRQGLAIPNALDRIEKELPPLPELRHLIEFTRANQRGIVR